MKIETYFNQFLENIVNLNKTRYKIAKSGVEVMADILKNDEVFGDEFIDTKPQGSFRQKTIIKPVNDGQDFDVDILFEMKEINDWEASDYLNKLAGQFKKMDRYKDKVDTRGKTRCVTIDYESDFHIDIVPSIDVDGDRYIMNKKTNKFEPTDGDGYAQWFEGQDSAANGNLVPVVKLIKYLRDSKKEFDTKSIILTTLSGMVVSTKGDYSDLPKSLASILSELKELLDSKSEPFKVKNPAIPKEESFDRDWIDDIEGFRQFKKAISDYSEIANQAIDLVRDEAIKKWTELFGEEFSVKENSETSNNTSSNFRDIGEQFLSDFGITENIEHKIKINARVIQDGWRPFLLRNTNQLLRKKLKLEFFIEKMDQNIMDPFNIKWKVKNTGAEAADTKDLRGEIIDDKGYHTKNENTKYLGQHYVECYIIKNDTCIARDKIDVLIGKL